MTTPPPTTLDDICKRLAAIFPPRPTRQLSDESREAIRRLVAEAPPLTEQQRFKLAAIFRPRCR